MKIAWEPLESRGGRWKEELNKLKKSVSGTFSVNAFDYLYQVKARNADLFFRPLEKNEHYANAKKELLEILTRLQCLELSGQPLSKSDLVHQLYLGDATWPGLRSIAVRPTARDELRFLAALLTRGPQTVDELARNLAVTCNLIERIATSLDPLLERAEEPDRNVWMLKTSALGPILYALRVKIGLNPLEALP